MSFICSTEVHLKPILSRQSAVIHSLHVVLPCVSPIHIILCFNFKICYSFHVIDGGYIKALLRRVYSYQLWDITQELELETS